MVHSIFKAFIVFFLLTFACGNATVDTETDRQIEQLEKHLAEVRLQASQAEIESQEFFRYDWKKYLDKVELAEKKEQEAKQLELQIEQLKHLRSTSETQP